MTTLTDPAADRALKTRHRAMWASGDYPAVAAEVIPQLGPLLVEACGVRTGERVLDVAAGSGNAAIPAALRGAHVVASDLTPELFDAGRRRAAEAGVDLQWHEDDAEALSFADAEFDTVMSCVGVMFAPHHEAAATELLRVCRPGGTIGLLSWTPEGFIGQLFLTLKPYAAAPPPGARPAPLWGSEKHISDLLGDGVTEVVLRRQALTVERFTDGAAFRDFFKACYGPVSAVYRLIADDPERVKALDVDVLELVSRFDRGAGRTVMDWEYLLVIATRA